MEKDSKGNQKKFISEKSGIPDPRLIPEDQISEDLDRRMKKIFENARNLEKTEKDSEE